MSCQLPKYTFICNETIPRAEDKWSEGLIYSPTLLAFLSQKDHYVLKVKDVIYIGEMLRASRDSIMVGIETTASWD